MLKMVIKMNEQKIAEEGKYQVADIQEKLYGLFERMGLSGQRDEFGVLTYRDRGRAEDFCVFGKIVNLLKRTEWFIDNAEEWSFEESDEFSEDEWNVEDLLQRYRRKYGIFISDLRKEEEYV